jgi:hypothetical protein
MNRRRFAAAVAAAVSLALATAAFSYSTYAKWSSTPVTFYVNPATTDITQTAAIAAVQFAMNVWNTQSGTTFRYQYGGKVADTATAYDNRNVMIFRNASNGSAIGTTYSWWDSNKNLLDSDIIIWDKNFTFYTGTTGCGSVSNGAYLEDIATHELGHALGLNHSASTAATMYPSYSLCSQALRTLASDDIAAAKALYPAAATAPVNQPPVVAITSPANGATFVQGSTVTLAATATDPEDGNLSSRIQWTDNGATIGSGNGLSTLLSLVGIHTFVAKVSDNNGAQGSSQVSITITLLPQSGGTTGTLTSTTGYNAEGKPKVTLRWTGLSGTSVDVFLNGRKSTTTANDGLFTDLLPAGTRGTFSYYVCEAGTTKCTNTISATF